MAASPVSPVRIRVAFSIVETNTLLLPTATNGTLLLWHRTNLCDLAIRHNTFRLSVLGSSGRFVFRPTPLRMKAVITMAAYFRDHHAGLTDFFEVQPQYFKFLRTNNGFNLLHFFSLELGRGSAASTVSPRT